MHCVSLALGATYFSKAQTSSHLSQVLEETSGSIRKGGL